MINDLIRLSRLKLEAWIAWSSNRKIKSHLKRAPPRRGDQASSKKRYGFVMR